MRIYTDKGYMEIDSLEQLKGLIENKEIEFLNFDTNNARTYCRIEYVK